MRRVLVAALSLAGLAGLAAPAAGQTQTVASFAQLPLRIDRGDQVRVVDQSGVRHTGRVVGFGRDGLIIGEVGAPRLFAESAVRQVYRRSASTGRGALIGIGLFTLVGAAVCDHSSAGAACPFLFGLTFGAGVGALVGAWVPSMHSVYRAASPPASVRAGATGPASPSLMDDLGMAVNVGDRLSVESIAGGTATGTLSWLREDGLAIRTGATEQVDFTRDKVRRVSVVRSRSRLGTLLGFAALSALCLPSAGSDWPDALLLCGGPGAGLGALVGHAISTATVVYPAPAPRLSVAPALQRGRAGVSARYRF